MLVDMMLLHLAEFGCVIHQCCTPCQGLCCCHLGHLTVVEVIPYQQLCTPAPVNQIDQKLHILIQLNLKAFSTLKL